MVDVTPLVGLRIRLTRTIDAPCAVCGESVVVVGHGAGPHVAALHCMACSRHRGWLPKAIAEFLLAAVSQFGWPPEAILIRNPEFVRTNEAALSGASATEEAHAHPLQP
jgi:hypothetical protein